MRTPNIYFAVILFAFSSCYTPQTITNFDENPSNWEYKGPGRGFGGNDGNFLVPQDTYASSEISDLPDLPKFIEQPPAELYVANQVDALVKCVASPVSFLDLKCANSDTYKTRNGKRMKPKFHTRGQTSIAELNVTLTDVEEWFDSLWCQCEAWNNIKSIGKPRAVLSRRTYIKVARLNKQFEQEPISQNVKLGAQVQFICQPPKGQPKPRVYWLKNRVKIKRGDPNYIITSEGYLVVSSTRKEDVANYTCVAENSFNKRREAEPVSLTYYVNGGWSEWFSNLPCSSKCQPGRLCDPSCKQEVQYRRRECNNPVPIGTGAHCKGSARDKIPCDSSCTVNGGWAKWQQWSACSALCQQTRYRTCTDPPPKNGGLPCPSVDTGMEVRNCSANLCKTEHNRQQDASKAKSDMLLYIGLCVALALLLLAIVIVVVCFRNVIFSPHHPHHFLPIEVNEQSNGISKNSTILKNSAPHNAAPPAAVNLPKSLPSVAAVPLLPHKPPLAHHNAVSASSYAVVHDSPASSRANRSATSGSHSGESATVLEMLGEKTKKAAPYHTVTLLPEHPGVMGPSAWGSDTKAAWGKVTCAGGRLALPECGVSLIIPPGAISAGSSQELYLAVGGSDKDRPHFEDNKTLLSSLIVTGPPNITLQRSVILSFHHCAHFTTNRQNWELEVWSSDKSGAEPAEWNEYMEVNETNSPSQASTCCQVDSEVCHLVTNRLAAYCLVGCTPSFSADKLLDHCPDSGDDNNNLEDIAQKCLRVAAFAKQSLSNSECDLDIRVRIFGDTKDAFERAVTLESRIGGRLLDTAKRLIYNDTDENLCISIESLNEEWHAHSNCKYQEIPFTHIWRDSQPNLTCTIKLKHTDTSYWEITGQILLYQRSRFNDGETIQIASSISVGDDNDQMLDCNPPPKGFNNSFIPPKQTFRLSVPTRKKMSNLLDPPSSSANDWRMLAKQFDLENCVRYLERQDSPTEALIDIWEARHREETAIIDLRKTLRAIGRSDVVAVTY